MTKKTRQIRILSDGEFEKLYLKIEEQFEKKHGFKPTSDQTCEAIARAVVDAKLF